jgi:hypothetical protein
MSESEIEEEIPMYRCLPFSYAVKYGFIVIDYERNSVEIPIRSPLSDNENKQLMDKLHKEHISYIEGDFLYPVHCPWCGIHLNIAIDFDKCSKIGQYSSKENREKKAEKLFTNSRDGMECCRRPTNEPT